MSDAVHDWISQELGPILSSEDCSWPREASKVWAVTTPRRRLFVKVASSRSAYAKEASALSLLGGRAGCPRLLATNSDLLGLALSALEGRLVRTNRFDVETERRIYTGAGRALAEIHACVEPSDGSERARRYQELHQKGEDALRQLSSVAEHLADTEIRLVERAAVLLGTAPQTLPMRYSHGDFQPRNWIWNERDRTLGVIDLETAGIDLRVKDLTWIAGVVWPRRPDLREVFLTGYGSALEPAEEVLMSALCLVGSLAQLHRGIRRGSAEMSERGLRLVRELAESQRALSQRRVRRSSGEPTFVAEETGSRPSLPGWASRQT